MRMVLPFPKYAKQEARRAFYDEVLRRVKETPGVEAAGMITFLLSFNGMNWFLSRGTHGAERYEAAVCVVSCGESRLLHAMSAFSPARSLF